MSSKGTNYNTFKTLLCVEKYMITLQLKHYFPIIKIRTSNHHLTIETDRWNNVLALQCGQIFVPEAIHNQLAIKLLVSGLSTGHICYVCLFLHRNRSYINILLVMCESFVILTSH